MTINISDNAAALIFMGVIFLAFVIAMKRG